ncbi:MAG: aminoacyl-histidine dipeptidase [Clostridiales bacterium]|jgi:dipeptidase D|nr:aminoacyl-histidine dipeptidase [Clostridiales bacterium]
MENAEKVFHFFEEISRIPRSSGDEKAISEYLVSFAKERGLEVMRDDIFNVIIKKPATVPDCTCAPVIIQGHTDMVYVREDGCERAYEDGIKLIYKDGWLTADGTTLGTDNGIAVAYALALLDSSDIPHPDIEAVFTVSEEIGLVGAGHLNYTMLKGKYLLNIDTEDEGIFYTSCAGAFRNDLRIPIARERLEGLCRLNVNIHELKGGHSGMEINEGRANAISLMARVLMKLGGDIHISSIKSEGKTNAISNNASAELYVEESMLESIEKRIKAMETEFKGEYGKRDSISIELIRGDKQSADCYDEDSRKKVISAMTLLPCGVMGMSFDIPDLVETSANPAHIDQLENELVILSSARSCVGSRKEEMKARYGAVADLCDGISTCSADYPQWEYRADSPLRELAIETYRELFGKEAKTGAIHAGLECGYFDEKLHGVDIISYGPDIFDVHTPAERANINSIERIWVFTQSILKKLAK